MRNNIIEPDTFEECLKHPSFIRVIPDSDMKGCSVEMKAIQQPDGKYYDLNGIEISSDKIDGYRFFNHFSGDFKTIEGFCIENKNK